MDWAEGNNSDMERWIHIYTEVTGFGRPGSEVDEGQVENIDRETGRLRTESLDDETTHDSECGRPATPRTHLSEQMKNKRVKSTNRPSWKQGAAISHGARAKH